jgi:LmbE family N-acetylglucosaminyl deacetylase
MSIPSQTQLNRRLLIAYAHPDDESFGLGALIAKYVAEGVDVYLICATDGGAGTVEAKYLENYGSIRELRLAELDCAAEKLGIRQVFNLGYKDSGMMNSETSTDPECLWCVAQNEPDRVTRDVVEVIREVQPQVVITFNKYGGYGHPDHIAIQRATTDAFFLAGDETFATGQPGYQPQKLYYSNIPRFMIQIGIWMMRLRGQDPRRVGVNKDIDIQAILDNCEPQHTRVDIRAYYDAWDEASACHASQGGGGGFSLIPKRLRRYLSPYQGFTRIYPTPNRDRIDEYDMFAGVQIDEQVPDRV